CQAFEVSFDDPKVKKAKVTAEGRVIGLLRSGGKEKCSGGDGCGGRGGQGGSQGGGQGKRAAAPGNGRRGLAPPPPPPAPGPPPAPAAPPGAAPAALPAPPDGLVNLCVPPHSVAACEDLSVNCHEGPVSAPISAGQYSLHQTFAIQAAHPRGCGKAASAE